MNYNNEKEQEATRNFDNAKQALNHMKGRYSCRAFSDEKIPDDVLKEILEVGLRAASGGNLQPYSIIVVKDEKNKDVLYEACAKQKFIKDADVNLVFLMDWHKYDIYTKQKNAPFVAYKSFFHFLIALEDIMCTAQTIETAAYLCGIGSCYVGSIIGEAATVKESLNLPDKTYPVLILSLGYPKNDSPTSIKKLSFDTMIFNEKYRDFKDEEIFDAYEDKYEGRQTNLPQKEPFKSETLELFKNALLTTYSEDEVKEILAKANEDGFVNETQRRFGLHYSAHELLEISEEVKQDMEQMGIYINIK